MTATLLVVSCLLSSQGAHTYYLSPTGNDANTGLSQAQAWKSLAKVSGGSFGPGDQILLEPGATFKGSLSITAGGTPSMPLVISSVGPSAIIDAGEGPGLILRTGGIELRNLVLLGRSTKKQDGREGVLLEAPVGQAPKHVVLDHLDVSGFGSIGISIKAAKGSKGGFQNVLISNTRVHGNYGTGIDSADGIAFDSRGATFGHHDLKIIDCDVSENLDGNGIILSGVDGAKVEYSRASGNRSTAGALGMWAWCAKNVTFRYCIANSTRGPNDAGGYDLDGGSVNCVAEHCLSFDNDGPGFMHCDFPDAPRTHDNIFRDSVSVNDGRKQKGSLYGFGFVVWGTGLYDCRIERNLTVVTKPNEHGRGLGANFVSFIRSDKLPLSSQKLEHGVFRDNTVFVDSPGPSYFWDDFPKEQPAQVEFLGNLYHGSVPPTFIRSDGGVKKEIGLEQWKALGNDIRPTRPRYSLDLGDLQKLRPRDLPEFFRRISR